MDLLSSPPFKLLACSLCGLQICLLMISWFQEPSHSLPKHTEAWKKWKYILHTTFSNAYSSKSHVIFWFAFCWGLILWCSWHGALLQVIPCCWKGNKPWSESMMSHWNPRIVLWMHPVNERWCYILTLSLIGWAHTQNDPWNPIHITGTQCNETTIQRASLHRPPVIRPFMICLLCAPLKNELTCEMRCFLLHKPCT